MKGEEEERTLDHFLLAFKIVPIDEAIAKRGGTLRRKYRPGHGTGLADALIAATAEQEEARLITFNVRHYRSRVRGLRVTRPGTLVERIRKMLAEIG